MKFIRLGGFTLNVEDISYILRKEITHSNNKREIKIIIKLRNGDELSTTEINDETYEDVIHAICKEELGI